MFMADVQGRTLHILAGPMALSLTGKSEESDRERQVLGLYKELRPGLFSYLRTMGVTREEAADIVQDTFLRLVTHLAGGGNSDHLRGWVFQVAHNLSVDLHRRERKHFDDSEDAMAVMHEKPDPAPNPEQQVLMQEKSQRLEQAISRLPTQQQRCVLLRAQGLRYWEIAQVLGVIVPTVSEFIQRAIVKLAGDR
jgi:RNA polymerase sigma-70 factor (ECF subfamily)